MTTIISLLRWRLLLQYRSITWMDRYWLYPMTMITVRVVMRRRVSACSALMMQKRASKWAIPYRQTVRKDENCHVHLCFAQVNLVLQEIDKMGELLPSSSAPATITSSSSPQPVGPWKKPVNQKPVKTKHSQVKRHIPCSIDSILSTITFDDRSDILTVSRMGSIYYCLEDLYLKLFSSLCTLEELTDLLIRSKTVLLKQVTLSEKIAIEERIPKLKSSCLMRYRLISLNFSDFLIKLKHLLLYHSAESRLERILKKMRDDNQSSTNVPRKENSSRCPTTMLLLFEATKKLFLYFRYQVRNE